MQIRRAEATYEETLARIRRSAILGLAVLAMSIEQAENWAAPAAADRIVRTILDHQVWVAMKGAAIGWVELDRDRVAAPEVVPTAKFAGMPAVDQIQPATIVGSTNGLPLPVCCAYPHLASLPR
jgi:hypothetical protein